MNLQNELDLYKFCPHCGSTLVAKQIEKENVKACTQCDFVYWNNPKPVVSAVIHHDGKVLMIQRANEPFRNYWVLPGGFISYDEIAEDAIKREVEEEIGTDIQLERIIGTYKIDTDP
ncbi:MAG: NUDIX domain-containing protein [Candidatus Levyibacteriota bacterium]